MRNFDVPGDIALDEHGRSMIRVKGIERIRSRLTVVLQIILGSYKYSKAGVDYLSVIGQSSNVGLMKKKLIEACMQDPEVVAVDKVEISYVEGRAYKAVLHITTKYEKAEIVL